MFRVFVSSSFEDMAEERRQLAARVFDPLAELCAARGSSFQAIDLRWGIPPRASLDQRTMPICLAEVRRCLASSPRLNLLVLVGDRRGWLPLPTAIPTAELAVLVRGMSIAERALVDRWYRLDTNAVPSESRLLPRTGRYVDPARWSAVEARLREILHRTAVRLPEQRHVAYRGSAVEQEVAAAAASPQGTFAVVRRTAAEVDPPDADRSELDQLEAGLRDRLPARRFLRAAPRSAGGASWERVVLDLYDRMRQVIESEPDRPPRRTRGASAAPPSHVMIGRDSDVAALTTFAGRPGGGLLGVVGEAGVGKSTLLSSAAGRLADELADHGDVIVRLLGTSASTARLDSVLRDLVTELAAALGQPTPAPVSRPELLGHWFGLLRGASPHRPVVLVIDAVDQLAADPEAFGLSWLPDPLPEHVRVIVSAVPGPVEDALRERSDTLVHELAGLSIEDGDQATESWLTDAGRTVTPGQRASLRAAFGEQRNPLWLRVAVEQALGWRSWTAPPELPPTLPELVRRLFDGIAAESARGPLLTRRTLALLAASEFGLSEADLSEVLSADPDVMTEVRARAHPRWLAEIVALPTVLWAQLRADLQPYLTEREVEGDVLIDFHHRTLREVAAEDLLRPPDGELRHRELALHFTRVADPAGDRSWQGGRARALGRLPRHLEAGRMWSELTRALLDLRFLERTALLVGRATSIDRAGRVRTSHSGVHVARSELARLLDGDAVLADEDRALAAALVTALGLEASLLVDRPDLLWQQLVNRLRWAVPQAAERLAAEERRRHDDRFPPWWQLLRPVALSSALRHVLRETGRARTCALSGDGGLLVTGDDEDASLWDAVSGVRLARLTGHVGPVRGVAVSPDGRTVVTADSGGTVRRWTWNGLLAGVAAQRRLAPRELRACAAGNHRIVVAGLDGLWFCAREDLSVLRTLDDIRHDERRVASCGMDEEGRLVVAGYVDGDLRAWLDPVSGATPRRRVAAHPGGTYGCAVDASGAAVLTAGQDGMLRRWDDDLEPTHEPLVDLALPTRVGLWDCAASDGLERAATALVGGAAQAWDMSATTPVLLSGHAGHVEAVSVSGDGTAVASAGFDGTVRLWDARAATSASAEPYSSQVQSLALSADGTRVLSVDMYGIARCGSTSELSTQREFDACSRMCMDASATADLSTLLVADGVGALVLWDVRDPPQDLRTLPHDDVLACVLISPRLAVSAALDGSVHGWDVVDGRRLWTLDVGGGVPGLVLAADHRSVLVTSESGTVQIVDPRTGQTTVLRHGGDAVRSGAFGPGGATAVGTAAGEVLLWDERGRPRPPVRAHSATVLSTAGGSPRVPFCSASADGTVAFWSVDREHVTTVEGHDGAARAVAVDAVSGLVYSAGDDKTLRAWNPTGEQRALLPLTGRGMTIAVDAAGTAVACGDDGGFVHVARVQE